MGTSAALPSRRKALAMMSSTSSAPAPTRISSGPAPTYAAAASASPADVLSGDPLGGGGGGGVEAEARGGVGAVGGRDDAVGRLPGVHLRGGGQRGAGGQRHHAPPSKRTSTARRCAVSPSASATA